MEPRHIIVASSNEGKVREIREILCGLPLKLTSLKDHWNPVPYIPEEGETFFDNAYSKISWVWSRIPNRWVLADDSGLEVDFLGGDPGVQSARYAGHAATDAENVLKLLDRLRGCALEKRTARFRCLMLLRTSEKDVFLAEGICHGTIALEPRGCNGFGYDPLFIPKGESRTFAELDSAVKNSISHRAKALIQLRKHLEYLLKTAPAERPRPEE